MEDTITGTTETAIIPEPHIEAGADITPPDEIGTETRLSEEIADLWSDHVRLNDRRKTTATELRQIRANLAERLYAMKSLLSRPGRGGQWRSWLGGRGIPRSTADRLVSRHSESLGTANNVLRGAIPEPSIEGVGANLAKTVRPELMKVLNSNESTIEFIASIAKLSGINHQWRVKGLMIFNAVPVAAGGLPGSRHRFPSN